MTEQKRSGVYLVHLDTPLGHNRHYMGFSTNIDRRLKRHAAGHGAKLLRAAKQKGIGFRLVRVWEGAEPSFERKLKNRKEGPTLCPICNPRYAATNATRGGPMLSESYE